jgi:hypothetical protein
MGRLLGPRRYRAGYVASLRRCKLCTSDDLMVYPCRAFTSPCVFRVWHKLQIKFEGAATSPVRGQAPVRTIAPRWTGENT